MNIISPAEPYVVAQAARSNFMPLDREYLSSIGYPLSGQGKAAILTYDVAGAASVPISPTTSTLTSILSGSASIALTASAVSLSDVFTFDPTAKLIRISFTGSGDINLTYDGTVPTSGAGGEVWFKGGILEINPTIASTIQLIKATTTSGSIYVTQFA